MPSPAPRLSGHITWYCGAVGAGLAAAGAAAAGVAAAVGGAGPGAGAGGGAGAGAGAAGGWPFTQPACAAFVAQLLVQYGFAFFLTLFCCPMEWQ